VTEPNVENDLAKALKEMLANSAGNKTFVDAVAAAFKAMHGGVSGRPTFNLDTMGFLSASLESYKYASTHMLGKPRFTTRAKLLEFSVENIAVNGPALEFGVWNGFTINHIASLMPGSNVYGFDSFEGLPEAWFGKSGGVGQFSRKGEPPKVRDNVELVAGWFDRTLPAFLDTHHFDHIALLHIDCDIYSSTQTVFAHLHSRIVPGTIIVFDEYFNYQTWERHEFKAFQEFVGFRQIRYEYIGLVPTGEQVAVRILSVM